MDPDGVRIEPSSMTPKLKMLERWFSARKDGDAWLETSPSCCYTPVLLGVVRMYSFYDIG